MNEERFRQELAGGNFIGAYAFLKSDDVDRTEQGVYIGQLANAIVQQLSAARARDDKERLSFLRSLLGYILKDFPGLASLYREQLRGTSSGFLPEAFQDIWRDLNDVLSGRKTVDEEIRQRFAETKKRVEEQGLEVGSLLKGMEDGLKRGMDGVRDFVDTLFSSEGSQPESSAKDAPSADKENTSGTASASNTEEVFKVNIQNADDPLPRDIHEAEPTDKKKSASKPDKT